MNPVHHLFDYLPHGEAMRLLSSIDGIDAETITCTVLSHQAPDHPMRFADRLGAACGVEMAAQAVAMHSAHRALQSADRMVEPPKGGMLTAVRELTLHTDRLDHYAQPLQVRAHFQAGDSAGALYAFSLHTHVQGQEQTLLDGRMSVVNFVR